MKSMTCTLRKIFKKNHKMIDLTSGFFAGYFSHQFVPHSFLTYLMASRMIDSFMNLAYEKKIWVKSYYDHIFIYTFFIGIISYA
jgi:hypothetical protein